MHYNYPVLCFSMPISCFDFVWEAGLEAAQSVYTMPLHLCV